MPEQLNSHPPRSVSGSHQYNIAACNDADCSTYGVGATATVTLPTTLGVPTGLQACTDATPPRCQQAGSSTVLQVLVDGFQVSGYKVSWNWLANATSYEVHASASGCGTTEPSTTPVAVPEIGVTAIGCGSGHGTRTVSYQVRGCAGSNCGGWTTVLLRVEETSGLTRSAPDTITYLHTDALHSAIAETDASGNVIVNSRPRYEPYGNPSVPMPQGPGYTGHVMDSQTGLVYMQQRYYDGIAGRFLSTDPIPASPASFNRYWYANNNPYKNIDPDGRQSSMFDHPSLRGSVQTLLVNPGRGNASEKWSRMLCLAALPAWSPRGWSP